VLRGLRAARAWLASDQWVSGRTRQFARWSAICSFALGMAGQVAYHLLAQAGVTRAPWPVTIIVSCLPVLPCEWASCLTSHGFAWLPRHPGLGRIRAGRQPAGDNVTRRSPQRLH
jgi:hypothetical protein